MDLTDKSLIDMAMAKCLNLYDAIVYHRPSHNMSSVGSTRQREAGMGDDWARPVVHWEIEAVDAGAQRGFYASMFNWEIGDGPVMQIPAGIGGPEPGPGGHLRQSDRSRVTLYVQVRDLEASLVKATELGATVVVERLDIPGGATLAAIADPEGNPVTLVQQ
jgi:predicted enzyme related to lactoylglutathione lyase